MISKKQESFYFAVALIIIAVMLFDFFVNVDNPSLTGNAVSSINAQCGNKLLNNGEACDSGIIRGYSKIIFNCSDGKRYSTSGGCYYPNYLKDYAYKICASKKNSSQPLVSYQFVDDCAIKTPVYCFQQSSSFVNKYSFIGCYYNNCTLDFSRCGESGTCGNGILEPGEKCDGRTNILCSTILPSSKNPNANVSCTSNCNFDLSVCNITTAVCGNGIKEADEQCDDGNSNSSDGCSSLCKLGCTSDSQCLETSCPGGGLIHQRCRSGLCVYEANCSTNFSSSCTDSDGGYNIYVKGTLTNSAILNGRQNSSTYSDSCYYNPNLTTVGNSSQYLVQNCSGSHCSLFEYACKDYNSTIYGIIHGSYGELTPCISGSCLNGACVNATSSTCGNGIIESGEECDDGNTQNSDSCTSLCKFTACNDSDNGRNYYLVGQTTGYTPGVQSIYTSDDMCLNSWNSNGPLQETWCENGTVNVETYNCPFGCSNGACINSTTLTCGNGLVESGEECDLTNISGKTCYSLGFSNGNLTCSSNCKINTSNCRYGTCNETDSGIDPYTFGVISQGIAGYNDWCMNAADYSYQFPNDKVVEVYCNNDVVRSVEITCMDGCEFGRCCRGTCTNISPYYCGDGAITSGEECEGNRTYKCPGSSTIASQCVNCKLVTINSCNNESQNSCTESNLYYLTPYVMSYNESSETIRFETTVPVNATIELYSAYENIATGAYSQRYMSSLFSTKWEVTFNNLYPSTRMYYKITVTNTTSGLCLKNSTFVSYFTTSDNSLDHFSFAVIGDTRHDTGCGVTDITYQLFNLIDQRDVDFVMVLGDIVHGDGTGCSSKLKEAWQDFHNSSSSSHSRIPFIATVGNHDVPRTTNGKSNWTNYWMLPMNGIGYSDEWKESVYYWRYANTLFISLNTYETNRSYDVRDSQFDWFKNTALKVGNVSHKFVFTHVPMQGSTRSDSLHVWNQSRADMISSLMVNNSVDTVFYGHDHLLCLNQTKDGLIHVISGGGGSPLHEVTNCIGSGASVYEYMIVEVNGLVVNATAYDISNNALGGFTVTKQIIIQNSSSAPNLTIGRDGGDIVVGFG